MNRVIRKIEGFLQTEGGQRLLQYGYSFGAAIVILGAMVKVLHLWGIWGNIIFGVGMAVEVVVFILYGFDRPVQPSYSSQPLQSAGYSQPVQSSQPVYSSGSQTPAGRVDSVVDSYDNSVDKVVDRSVDNSGYNIASSDTIGQLDSVAQNVEQFAKAVHTLTSISESLHDSYRHIIDNSQNISHNSLGYVQQMEALNRNISGLNTIYEIQLKGISGQIDTLDQINKGLSSIKDMYSGTLPDSSTFRDETEKMTKQIQELNSIYSRMIQAMTMGGNTSNQPQ